MTRKQARRANGNGSRPTRSRRSQQMSSNRPHGTKSQAVRDQAILALLSEKSVAKAAARCGLSERTLHRWLTGDDAFQAEYSAAREANYQSGLHRVQALTAKAVDTLEDLLDAKINPNVRLGAARTVAEIGIHQHDAETILKRLKEMESDQRRQQGR